MEGRDDSYLGMTPDSYLPAEEEEKEKKDEREKEKRDDYDGEDVYNYGSGGGAEGYGAVDIDDEDEDDVRGDEKHEGAKTAVTGGGEGRQWNTEFQELLRSLGQVDEEGRGDAAVISNQQLKKDLKLLFKIQTLSMEFTAAAKRIGAQIIRERHLPIEKKTYPPIDVGGMAGGEKCVEYTSLSLSLSVCLALLL